MFSVYDENGLAAVVAQEEVAKDIAAMWNGYYLNENGEKVEPGK